MHGHALIPSDADTIMRRLDELARCTAQAGEITRLFLTPAHAQAVSLVSGWMGQSGLTTRLDACGTLVGTMPDMPQDSPVLLLGSHIDTVRNAGRYDGCLGVVLSIALAARARRLPYAIELRAFGDEEGVRFPVTLTGARATAGMFDPAWLHVQDSNGVTLETAMRDFGLDPSAAAAGACTAHRAFAYLEVHIEQGPVLEAAGAPVGIVTAIAGAARFEVTVTGMAGHAGTVPMSQRRDALTAAAEMVLAVQRIARAQDVVATVGRLTVYPDAINVIPGRCVFTIDLRAALDASRDAAEQAILAALHVAAHDSRVEMTFARTHAVPAVACDPRLQTHLAEAASGLGLPLAHLPSGAGHDAMAVAKLCPIGMLFVRCAGGVSHHPDESVTEADVGTALDVMWAAMQAINAEAFVVA